MRGRGIYKKTGYNENEETFLDEIKNGGHKL